MPNSRPVSARGASILLPWGIYMTSQVWTAGHRREGVEGGMRQRCLHLQPRIDAGLVLTQQSDSERALWKLNLLLCRR